jgi:phage FluMu protein Com
MALNPQNDSVEIAIGVAFRFRVKLGLPPFRLEMNKVDKNEANKANKLSKAQIDAGFDCVKYGELDADGGNPMDAVFWIPGTVLPLATVTLKLKYPCSICMDRFLASNVVSCEANHFVCFGCLESYALSEQPGQDIASQKNVNADGELTCPVPDCRLAYKRQALQGCPQATFVEIEKIKLERFAQKRVQDELVLQEKRMREEWEKIMKMEGDERRAHIVRHELVNDVLNLRCPRCKLVFADFEGCFALTCSSTTCRCGFCAWCLKDCGADAHSHVPHCPESREPGAISSTLAAFDDHHRRRREKIVHEKFLQEPTEVQNILASILEPDVKPLGISLPIPVPSVTSARSHAAAQGGGAMGGGGGGIGGGREIGGGRANANILNFVGDWFAARGFQDQDFDSDED